MANDRNFEGYAGIITLDEFNRLSTLAKRMRQNLKINRLSKNDNYAKRSEADISEAGALPVNSRVLSETDATEYSIRELEEFLANVVIVTDKEIADLKAAHKMTLGSRAIVDYDNEMMKIYLTNRKNALQEDENGFLGIDISSKVGELLNEQTEGCEVTYVDDFNHPHPIVIKKVFTDQELKNYSTDEEMSKRRNR